MSAGRTEQPTPRRLREARRRGDVARSRELSGAAALAGGLAGAMVAAPASAALLARALRAALASAAAGAPAPEAVLRDALALVARASLAPCAGALVAGAAAAALQAGLGFSPEAVRPRLERLDPLRGVRRVLSPAQALQALLAVAKAAVLAGLLWRWLRASAGLLSRVPAADPAALWALPPLLLRLAWQLCAAALVLGLVDWALARRRHLRALRMTRDEVRREQREDEGDPALDAERRRRHRGLLEGGPASRATCVVVNPTHVAVALQHHRGGDDPPRVVAKGAGRAAARIRSAARRAGVPIVRDVPLARALHRLAEVGDEIPEQLYDAAAAILAHVYAANPEEPA